MLDKVKVKELYLQGKNAVMIADELNAGIDAVRKCIQRNLKKCKQDHIIAKVRDKEILRITRKEACSYMKDDEFIKRNPSIYKTDSKGDKVIDTDISGAVPFDVPGKLSNEFAKERVDSRIVKSGYRKSNEIFSSL